MFLLTKRGKRRAICRLCRALHGPKDCPRRPSINSFARRFAKEALAFQAQLMREKAV